ncbi:threonine ammonia-lyase [Lentisphaerota bacterium ZTH]|nr:threonine ammonia-lyase [Lentisphaerota bacterium]WET06103.1 threonine ammonia-lyase [Lentisphaerota bacterium ZTH]
MKAPTLQDIQSAASVLRGIIKDTNLIYSPVFSEESGNQVYIKPENLQETGAFKIRGAYNKISRLPESEKQKGLIAASAGNHAQGVAFAASKAGARCTIVMPQVTPLIKVEATRRLGAEVILAGDYYDQAYEKACELVEEHGYTFIHPFDDPEVIAGQGTTGLEILQEMPDADAIIVPVGGGGLISGIAIAAKAVNPDIRIIGVEPAGASSMDYSLIKGKVSEISKVQTIADGVATKVPGNLTFEIVKDMVDKHIVIPEEDLMEAFLLLLERHKLVAENSGILSLAALKYLNMQNKKIVSVVSGGNIDVVTISSMIDRGLVQRGRLFCFAVDLPDKPGELLEIVKIITRYQANVIKLDHNQFKALDRLQNVQLEITLETNGHEHVRKLVTALEKGGYSIKHIY